MRWQTLTSQIHSSISVNRTHNLADVPHMLTRVTQTANLVSPITIKNMPLLEEVPCQLVIVHNRRIVL